jgi:hypothetical protein
MKTRLLGAAIALALAAMPLASFAGGVSGGNANSDWTIYGWQNHSYNFIESDENNGPSRDFDRIDTNAANIGFAASIDTGLSLGGTAIKANVQCEQFTYFNHLAGGTGWCNRNSKLSLSGAWGEVGVAIWLLPFNEMVAQWVDPFYDAGLDSSSSIMGTHGLSSNFYNGGTFDDTTLGGDFDYSSYTIYEVGFSRRQENLLHWWSPNWNGFNARFAMTAGNRDEANGDLDPQILSTGITYTTDIGEGDNLWLALTYEEHDEWVAASNNQNQGLPGSEPGAPLGAGLCTDSDDDAYRIAGRYIHDWGNGSSTQLSAMYEELSWDADCEFDTLFDDLEIEHYMISGKHNFAGPWDFRFSYMDADEYDCGNASVLAGACVENDSDAIAFNIGLFYTMPAGTELRLVYSEVDNEDNGTYDFGINGAGGGPGSDKTAIGIGMVQWF